MIQEAGDREKKRDSELAAALATIQAQKRAVQNDALKQDLADEKTRSAALLHERDTANAVARGGTIWLRLKRAAKWFAIGVATGAAVAAIAHR